MLMEEPMASPATVEIQVDLPAGIGVCEYERIDEGHAFHVEWDLPLSCCCESCKRETPLNLVEKNKFLSIRDLDIWGQPSFFVYRESMHRCPHCGHRQSLLPPFKRRDVKYTYRFEEHVLVSLITSTGEDVAKKLGIAVETVDRIVNNRIQDAMGKGRDEAAAKTCLDVLTLQQREAVQFHHTDMGPAFLSACEAGLKNSKS